MHTPDEETLSEPNATIHGDIARLARVLHGPSEADVKPDAVLRQVTSSAVALLPMVDHAGVTLVHRRSGRGLPELESTAETGNVPRQFDDLQHEYGDGPCFEAIWAHRTVTIPDFRTEERWPKLVAGVLDQTPVLSTLSIQLFLTDRELGALNLHSESADAFDEEIEDLATTLATHAAIALSTARRGEQFRSALASRDIIGQAKGIIMERYDTDALHAFDILRRLSQDTNTPVADVAKRLVEADHPER
ncbi:GAF and ANTAR domain-containing protein [Gordonia sp. CPCC 206044]|uniref:GAF and ANTAR domain-containing protein n=1 Tax=Gordonia sp. CPCC 206044 TaxID=3140793 RepID=UPI003AF3DD23